MSLRSESTRFKAGKEHVNWKGGCPGYCHYEARKKINCPKGLIVHHVNGNWKDNSLENLQIMTQSEHVGIHNRERLGSIKPNSKIRKIIERVLELKKQSKTKKQIAEILNINFRMAKRCLSNKWRCQYE